MHSEIYCRDLPALDRIAAIRAIHEAWLQIGAGRRIGFDCLDLEGTTAHLAACLAQAGHVAFQDGYDAERRIFGSAA